MDVQLAGLLVALSSWECYGMVLGKPETGIFTKARREREREREREGFVSLTLYQRSVAISHGLYRDACTMPILHFVPTSACARRPYLLPI
jgi:hypothetical protein